MRCGHRLNPPDKAVIPTWPVDRPPLAEADAGTCVLDWRRRMAAVAPGFAGPQQSDGLPMAALCVRLRGVSGRVGIVIETPNVTEC